MIFRDFVLDDFVHGKFIECFILSVQNSELKAIDCHFKNHCFKGKYVPHSKAWKWNSYQFAISSKACGPIVGTSNSTNNFLRLVDQIVDCLMWLGIVNDHV